MISITEIIISLRSSRVEIISQFHNVWWLAGWQADGEQDAGLIFVWLRLDSLLRYQLSKYVIQKISNRLAFWSGRGIGLRPVFDVTSWGPSSKQGQSERECGELEAVSSPTLSGCREHLMFKTEHGGEKSKMLSPFQTHVRRTEGKQFQNLLYRMSMSSSWKSNPQRSNLP